jgi:hypothetical protein
VPSAIWCNGKRNKFKDQQLNAVFSAYTTMNNNNKRKRKEPEVSSSVQSSSSEGEAPVLKKIKVNNLE